MFLKRKPDFEVINKAKGNLACLLAEFESVDQLVQVAKKISSLGYKLWDAYSPFPIHELSKLEKRKATLYRWFVFFSGLTGAVLALLLQWYTNAVDYPFLVSGKPYFSLPANIPVTFELTILFSATAAFFGMLAFNGLPRLYHPISRSGRFRRSTTDRFFVSIDAQDENFDPEATKSLLIDSGALSVEEIFHLPPSASLIPRGIIYSLIAVGAVALVPLGGLAVAMVDRPTIPRPSIVPDMDAQPKYKPQGESKLFSDGREIRPPVTGTVAWGELREDESFYLGKADGKWVDEFPIVLSEKVLERGKERFNIYCAPCHGFDGAGLGMVAKRAEELEQATWVPPANLHSENVRKRPLGHLFNTITNGIRKMPPYKSQIPTADRWAIVAYIKALQRSQQATIEDVPAHMKSQMVAAK